MTQHHAAHAQRLPHSHPISVPSREPLRQNVNARIGQLGFGRAQGKEVVDLAENTSATTEETPPKRRKLSSDGAATSKGTEDLSQSHIAARKQHDKGNGRPISPSERTPATPATASSKALGPGRKSSVLEKDVPSPPPLPPRPWKDRPHEVLRAARHERDRSIPKREVPTTLYKISSPQDAPILKEDREFSTSEGKTI